MTDALGHDLGALGGEPFGVGEADPLPRTGDDRHPDLQPPASEAPAPVPMPPTCGE